MKTATANRSASRRNVRRVNRSTATKVFQVVYVTNWGTVPQLTDSIHARGLMTYEMAAKLVKSENERLFEEDIVAETMGRRIHNRYAVMVNTAITRLEAAR